MGNIRVLCRVRPINKTEVDSGKAIDVTVYPEGSEEDIVIRQEVAKQMDAGKPPPKGMLTASQAGGNGRTLPRFSALVLRPLSPKF